MADVGGPRSSNVIGVGNLPKGQTYGTGAQQQKALAAVPLSGGSGPRMQSSTQVPAGLQPGQIPSLEDPTARPDEPITAGLPVGSGPGPEALGLMPQGPEELAVLRALYTKYKNEDIRKLMEWAEQQG